MIVEICVARGLAGWASGGTQGLEIGGERFQNPRSDGKVGELPFPANVDQFAGLEFLDVV